MAMVSELPPPIPAMIYEIAADRSGVGPQPHGRTGLELEKIRKNAFAHWQKTSQAKSFIVQPVEESSEDYIAPPPQAEYRVRVRVAGVIAGIPLPIDLPQQE